MRWTSRIRSATAWLGLLATGCTQIEDTAPGATVLAKVGSTSITSDDLDRVSERFGTDGASDTDEWRRSLQLLIDKQLLLLEGQRLGLPESPGVRAVVQASYRRNLTEALLKRRYRQRLEFSESQLQAWYDSTGAGLEIRVTRVVMGDRGAAVKALRQAAEGGRLQDLDIPADDVVSRRDLGWLSRLTTPDPRMAPLFDAQVGSVELIESEGNFFLMEVIDRREMPFAERREAARSILEGERRAWANLEYLEYLLAKYEVRVDTVAVQRLAEDPEAARLDPRTRLVHSSLGDWSLGEYLHAVERLEAEATEGSSPGTGALGFRLTRAFVVAQLLPREASEAGLVDSLAALRDAVVERGTIEALWTVNGFDPESAAREPERFDEYLEQLRQRFAERVHLDEEAYLAYVARKRRSDAPVEY